MHNVTIYFIQFFFICVLWLTIELGRAYCKQQNQFYDSSHKKYFQGKVQNQLTLSARSILHYIIFDEMYFLFFFYVWCALYIHDRYAMI